MLEPLAPAGGKRPLIVIILMNLIPLIGVLWLGWNIKLVVLLYIVETLLTVFFNTIKLLMCITNSRGQLKWYEKGLSYLEVLQAGWESGRIALFMLFFFATAGVLLDSSVKDIYHSPALRQFLLAVGNVSLVLMGDLVLFVARGENRYDADRVFKLMKEPFKRVFIQHFVVMAGMMLSFLGGKFALTLVFIGAKLYTDIRAHQGHKSFFDRMAEDEILPE